MTVGDIEMRHPGKALGDGAEVVVPFHHPELMAESIYWRNEVILRLLGCIAGYDGIQDSIIGISQKDRFHVGIAYTHMLHAVLFLVPSCEFVLQDHSVHIVSHSCSHHQSVLCVPVHRLGIHIIVFVGILHQPSLALELGKVVGRTLIHALVIFAGSLGEVYFGFDDMIERLLIVAGFCPCLLAVQHVVRPALHLLYQFARRAQSSEWFYDSHYLFTWNLVTPSFR